MNRTMRSVALVATVMVAGLVGASGSLAAAPPTTAPTQQKSAAGASGDKVIPRIQNWSAQGGFQTLSPRTRLLIDRVTSKGTVQPGGRAEFPGPVHQTGGELATAWRAELREATGLSLSMPPRPVTPQPADVVLRLVDDSALGSEGYRLDTRGPVVIEAATSNGLFYGTRTMNQMLAAATNGRTLERGVATDVPDQAVRMVQLDAGRKYWSIDYLRGLIRRMGDLKLNTLFLHLSDAEGFRLDSPKFPGLADPKTSYDYDDIQSLRQLGAKHHVQIMGGIDVPGHGTRISQTYGIGFGSGTKPCTQAHTHAHLTPDWIIDITSDAAVTKSAELVREFSSWFDAPLFSIGADELPGQLGNCPRVRDAIAADDEVGSLGDLLTRYINTLDGVVREGGKRTAIYNGVENMDTPQQDLNSSIVNLTWEGTGSEPAIPGHDEIAIGPFYLTPNNYHDLYPKTGWMYKEWTASDEPDMLGAGLPSWADYNFWAKDGYFEKLMALPRAVLADRSWNASPTPDSLADFVGRVGGLVAPLPTADSGPRGPEQPGPVHHWTFDNAEYPTGWTWAGSRGNTIMVEDIAGDLPGTSYIINNPTVIADAVAGQAFRFDHAKDGVGFGGVDLAQPWTVTTWVRLARSGGNQVLLSSTGGQLKLSQPGTGAVGLTDADGTAFSFPSSLPVGRWTQITLVADGTKTMLYVNGRPTGSIDTSIALPLRSIGSPQASLYGDLDEMVTWNRALTADEVAQQFASYNRSP